MTTTEQSAAAEQPKILTTSVEVPDLGTVDEERAEKLNAEQLKSALKVLGIRAPSNARKGDLKSWLVNGLRLQAMADANAPVAAIGPAPAPPVDEDEDGPMPAGVLEPARPAGGLPSLSKWQHLTGMAEYIAKSNLCPEVLRGKPNDVGVILLHANDLGIGTSVAMTQIYVIHGKVGMEAKLMRAVVRRDGHSIGPSPSPDPDYVAYYTGTRADTGDTYTGEFTLDDAVDQELITSWRRADDGTITLTGKASKPQWVKDTRNMLKERACSRTCRELFSDCLAGLSYTPEELGFIDVDPDTPSGPRGRAGESEPTMTINQQQSEIAARIEELPEDLKEELRTVWKARNLQGPAKLTPAGIRTARALLEPIEAKAAERQAAADAQIPDAELVDTPDAEPAATAEPAMTDDTADDADTATPDLVCGGTTADGCGEPIRQDQAVVFSDAQQQPYHVECATFV